MRSAQNLCFVVNRFYALFRLNGSSKPSLTSKPLLTIALKILKTIEKPLVPMVGPPKKHSMVMVQLCQNHWKTIDGNGGLKKTLTIPSPWKIDHRCGLIVTVAVIVVFIIIWMVVIILASISGKSLSSRQHEIISCETNQRFWWHCTSNNLSSHNQGTEIHL